MSGENPARQSREAYAALLAVITGVAVSYFTLPIAVTAILLPFAIPGALCAFMVGMIRSDQAKKRARMERGEGVVARWHLDAARWQEFERRNKGVIVIPHIAAGRFETTAPTATAAEPRVDPGVEVIFADDAVYVDGDDYTMDRTWGTTATLHPSYIELAQGGLDSHCPICVPVPAGHHADAERVARYFNATPG